MKLFTRSFLSRLLTAGLCLILSGCIFTSKRPVHPTTTATQVVVAVPATAVIPGPGGPGVVTATFPPSTAPATMTSTVKPGEAAARTATSANCPVPDGWVMHTIRQDETLYYLATSTSASVEQVMKANCLASDLIRVGGTIFLPSIPPVRATFALVEQPQPAPASSSSSTPCASPLGCISDLPPIPRPPATSTPTISSPCPYPLGCFMSLPPIPEPPTGYPSEADTFVPCDDSRNPHNGAWIDVYLHTLETTKQSEIGKHAFFYACNFQMPLSAKVYFPNGLWTNVNLLYHRHNPYLSFGNAQAEIDWPALPGQPTYEETGKPYYVEIQGADGTLAKKELKIYAPKDSYILVTPLANPLDGKFDVYYVNFLKTDLLTAQLFGNFANPPILKTDRPGPSWQVHLDHDMPGNPAAGWTKMALLTAASDPRGIFLIKISGIKSDYFALK